jgi:hypothetical protein
LAIVVSAPHDKPNAAAPTKCLNVKRHTFEPSWQSFEPLKARSAELIRKNHTR